MLANIFGERKTSLHALWPLNYTWKIIETKYVVIGAIFAVKHM